MSEGAPVAASQPPPGGAPGRPGPSVWLVTASVTIGTLMGALDASIVNVALPHIRANLGASVTEVTWVSTGYIIALVIIMPMTAWLGMTFGRKRVYMTCMALFVVASFFCGNAHGLLELVIFRMVQGLGAGALQPTEQAILREVFPVEQHGLAMGLYGFAVMIGPAAGPTLGGWITENYNWPWIFYVNLPIGVVGLWMVNRFVHDPPHARAQRGRAGVDAVGISTLAVGLGCLQGVLEEGQRFEWFSSNLISGLAALSVLSLAFFVWWELRVPKPVVNLRVLKNVPFTTGSMIGAILGVGLFGSMFLLPLFMQELLGYTALKSGLVMLPRALVMLSLLPIMGMLYNRLGPRLMIFSGLTIGGVAAYMMSRFSLDTTTTDLFWPQVIQGMGFAQVFVALSTTSLASIPRPEMTNATGLYNLIRQLGGSVGVAICATMVERAQQAHQALLNPNINPYSPGFTMRLQQLQEALMLRGLDPWTAHSKAMAIIQGMVTGQSAALAFAHTFGVVALLFFVCLPLVFVLRRPPELRRRARVTPAE